MTFHAIVSWGGQVTRYKHRKMASFPILRHFNISKPSVLKLSFLLTFLFRKWAVFKSCLTVT